MKLATLLLTFDDPELAGVADILDEQIAKEAAVQQFEWQRKFIPVRRLVSTKPINVGSSSSADGAGGSEDGSHSAAAAVSEHREALLRALQDLFTIPKDTIMVVTLLAGPGREDYTQVRELCQHTTPPIECMAIPYIGGMKGDVSLLVRNIVRTVATFVTGRVPGDTAAGVS